MDHDVADDIAICSDREPGTGRREAGELEICFGEKRDESQWEKDRIQMCE